MGDSIVVDKENVTVVMDINNALVNANFLIRYNFRSITTFDIEITDHDTGDVDYLVGYIFCEIVYLKGETNLLPKEDIYEHVLHLRKEF